MRPLARVTRMSRRYSATRWAHLDEQHERLVRVVTDNLTEAAGDLAEVEAAVRSGAFPRPYAALETA